MQPTTRILGRRATDAAEEPKFGQNRPSTGGAAPKKPKMQGGGFHALDQFALHGIKPAQTPRPARFAAQDPYRDLRDNELIRAIRGMADSKKHIFEYGEVRKLIFALIDNVGGKVECLYTGRTRAGGDLPDDNDMNIEHIWPQSKGAKGLAKRDLHNTKATDSEANGQRGNHPFGIVTTPLWQKGGSILGTDSQGETCFTPRPNVRGDVARTMFYFAAVYGFDIDAKEEAVLRSWDKADPVDASEQERNKKVTAKQGNGNDFVSFPNLIDRIKDI